MCIRDRPYTVTLTQKPRGTPWSLTDCGAEVYFIYLNISKYIRGPGSVDIDAGEVILGQWRNEIIELWNEEKYGGYKSTDMAEQVRNRLREYFNKGAVLFQYKNIF